MGALRIIAFAAALACAVPAAASPLDRWSAHIDEASRRFGVPQDWIRRVMSAESGGSLLLNGRPIVSPAGAIGLMQLMPGTWSEMRARLGLGSDPHDPRDNILAGTAYLRLMHERFGYPGLFAAYNAGPARYAAALDGRRHLPLETRFYVSGIMGVAWHDPRRSGGRLSTTLFALSPGHRSLPAVVRAIPSPPDRLFVQLGTPGS